ncbi:MAG: hypothetical protein HC767_02020 [Akkermansiaceae bacterium]|nr:hypothetical protein [Akkermansiaceae bacterium]
MRVEVKKLAPKAGEDNAATHLFEALAGLEFAFALGFSRMISPSVVRALEPHQHQLAARPCL